MKFNILRPLIGTNKFYSSFKYSRFATIDDSDLKFFESLLDKSSVRTNDIDDFNTDFMKWYRGKSECVLLPSDVNQVSAILKYCHQKNIAVVPQAGNTGLVGGSVPVHDEIILSTKSLKTKFCLDESAGILQCGSGFILEDIDNQLTKKGFMMPLDLGAKGTCLIGGNVATNAGGIRLIKYGSMFANVLGLEVVLPDEDGTILKLGRSLRKDNSDLHLSSLFIGSEGQLGIISEVSMLVVPRPKSFQTALFGVNSFQNCVNILELARTNLNEILSSFEMMDVEAVRSVKENLGIESQLSTNYPFNLLIETSGSNADHDEEKFEEFYTTCMEKGLASDGLLAASAKEAELFWKIRESVPLAQIPDGYVYKHDFSLHMDNFYELTEAIRERLRGKYKRVVTFGHLGDGNTHLNVTTASYDKDVSALLYPFIYEWVAERGGSISAEHGIGQYKLSYHHKLTAQKKLELNSKIKKIFDPRGILSPYKMVDAI